MGRDVLARIIYGARISLAVGIGATALGCLIGMAIGLLSGFFGGWFDLIVQRLIDIMQSLPLLVMALVMAASLGPSLTNTIIAIAIPLVPTVARTIRSNTLSLREMPFVEAARAVGMSETRIAVQHVLPNTLAPLIVLATAQLGSAILVEIRARVPGARRPRAAPLLGPHAVGVGGRVRAHRTLAGDLPRRRHQRRGVRHQPAGRRHPRHPRSTAAVLDGSPALPATRQGRPRPSRVLEVEDLRTYFYTRGGLVKAVDGVSFSLRRGEMLAIVGESGCGKSVTALSLMRLVADPPGRIVDGSVRLDGVDLLGLDAAAMRDVRGKEISMIFQEPMTSLNPVMTIGRQIGEALMLHEAASRKARRPARSRCCSWSASPSPRSA